VNVNFIGITLEKLSIPDIKRNQRLRCRISLYVICCTFLSISIGAKAEPIISTPKFSQLSTEQGLPQDTVNETLLDSNHFLWLATEEGLVRYDGYRTTLVPGQNEEFLYQPIYHLMQDSSGYLWVSTALRGVYRFNPKNQEAKQIVDFLSGHSPEVHQYSERIREDQQGNIWIAMSETIVKFDPRTEQSEVVFTLNSQQLKAGMSIRDIWLKDDWLIAASVGGLLAVNIRDQKQADIDYLQSFPSNQDSTNAKDLFVTDDGQLLIATVDGLYALPFESLKTHLEGQGPLPESQLLLPKRNVWSIAEYSDNMFYIATDKGLYSYNSKTQKTVYLFRPTDSQEYLSDDSIVNLKVDKNNNLWMGTFSNGALYWSPDNALFTNIFNVRGGRQKKVLSHNHVLSFHQQVENSLWIGTQNGLTHYDLKTGESTFFLEAKTEKPNDSLSSIENILPAGDSALWIFRADGLIQFDTSLKQIISISSEKGNADETFSRYFSGGQSDKQNNLYLLSELGFQRYDASSGQLENLSTLDQQLNVNHALKFMGTLTSEPNKMLISMQTQVWMYDIELDELELIHELPADKRSLFIYPDSWQVDAFNTLWIAYPGYGLVGLNLEDYQEKYFYNKDNILPTNSIYGLQRDKVGNIWMSSHSGLLRLYPNSQHIERFSSERGLTNTEFNQGAGIKLNDGRLVYGSPKGVSLFNPGDFNVLEKQEASVTITNVNLLSKQLSISLGSLNNTEVSFSDQDLGLSIHFSTLGYHNQESIRYQYNLLGADEVAFPATKNSKVMFPKLSAGTYEFSVSAFDSATGVQTPPARLSIRVTPAPWRSNTAFVIYALLLFSVINIWLYKRRTTAKRLADAHSAVLHSKNRLTLALSASNSDIWECQLISGQYYAPRLSKELGYPELDDAIEFEQHLELIHPQDRLHYETLWKRFISRQDDDLDVSYRMLAKNGGWLWFRDSGRVVQSNVNNEVTLVTGTYTNITDNIADQENLRLFGEAFKHTHDWVVIYDSDRLPIAVNDAFRNAFSLSKEANVLKELTSIYEAQFEGMSTFWPRLRNLKVNENWKGEDKIAFRDGSICDALVHVNAIASANDKDKIDYYLLIISDISEQKVAEEKLLRLANFDSLTGLPNRVLLLDRIQRGIEHASRHSKKMALFFIDLDRFKQVNDSLGHNAGDELLKIVAQRLTNKLRKDDTVARLGGDEFVIMLEDVNCLENISNLVNELSLLIDQPVKLVNQTVSVSSSIGIAMYPGDGENAEELLKNADIAMYHAKASGNFQFFTEHMDALVKERLALESKLKENHQNKGFENYYQAIVNTYTLAIVGFEILMRWPTDDGMIPPDKFIPVSEEIGLIESMTLDAFERALPMLKQWRSEGFSGYLSVNLSARHFDNQSSIEQIMLLLEENSIPVSAIRFEITEGALMRDDEKALKFMLQIKKKGFLIALDDFGTGYSSLKYLKEFPINIIKVDKSFVDDIGKNKNNEAIILTTLSMAEQLNMSCVAEGIETAEQLAFFREHSCAHLQGYYFSKPVPGEQVKALLAKASAN
jgi:diguanylate cyclase (GGDEF)-like protein